VTSAADSAVALRERRPDLRLAADLARLAGADGRYGACDDATVVVAVGRWTALISALEAQRLEAVRAVVRRNPAAGPGAGPGGAGDLPGAWLEDAGIQVGLELSRGPRSVSPMLELAVQLTRLPLSELKIDQSFVTGATGTIILEALIETSVAMARRLNLKTVAEGIESIDDWQLVSRLGCDIAQGYFIAKPMPGDQLPRWYAQWLGGRGVS